MQLVVQQLTAVTLFSECPITRYWALNIRQLVDIVPTAKSGMSSLHTNLHPTAVYCGVSVPQRHHYLWPTKHADTNVQLQFTLGCMSQHPPSRISYKTRWRHVPTITVTTQLLTSSILVQQLTSPNQIWPSPLVRRNKYRSCSTKMYMTHLNPEHPSVLCCHGNHHVVQALGRGRGGIVRMPPGCRLHDRKWVVEL